ncbi:MAG: hypothetical protein KF708_09395 [Pirellulales bacterium]|nr:hypothetical protein [Pirellulales bacterium]
MSESLLIRSSASHLQFMQTYAFFEPGQRHILDKVMNFPEALFDGILPPPESEIVFPASRAVLASPFISKFNNRTSFRTACGMECHANSKQWAAPELLQPYTARMPIDVTRTTAACVLGKAKFLQRGGQATLYRGSAAFFDILVQHGGSAAFGVLIAFGR